jgi:outer membrane protein assembly factor BamB
MLLLQLTAMTLLAFGARTEKPPGRLIEPPFVRKWTYPAGEQASVLAVREGVIYYYSHAALGALDLATGRSKWTRFSKESIDATILQNRTIYAAVHINKTFSLVALDLSSFRTRTLARLPQECENLAADTRRLYVIDEFSTLRAYSIASGRTLWSRQLPQGKTRLLSAQIAAASDALYLSIDEVGEFGLNLLDGKILWNRPIKYAGRYRPIAFGRDFITQIDGIQRINGRTGKIVWKAKEPTEDIAQAGNVLIGCGRKDLMGLNAASGHVLWHMPLRDPGASYGGFGSVKPPAVSDGERVWLYRNPVLCVTRTGHETWAVMEPFTGRPIYADRGHAITTNGDRILCYVAGKLPPLPSSNSERRALAERLASQYEFLDDAERNQLKELIPFSFKPLLARYIEWVKAYDAKSEHKNDAGHRSRFDLYGLVTYTPYLLSALCRKEDTPALVAAWLELGNKGRRGVLERILQDKGDPTLYIPLLVRSLRRLPLKDRGESAALSAVSHSSHPEAVALLIKALRNPNEARAWRQAAFQHLAGTGGPEGLQAVREFRAMPGPRKPWYECIDLSKSGQRVVLDTKADSKGRTWVLFHSRILGNESDLFIVQKLDSGWGRPLFTGVWTRSSFRSEAAKEFRGIPLSSLVKTEWIRIFPDDPAIRADSDGDGLTDLVEARLGTDPNKADTDGDGIPDAADPCPNAAPRTLSDVEQIVAASVEARFFLEDEGVPTILSVKDVKPFELYGYSRTVLWAIPEYKSELNMLYGGGVNIIGFHSRDLEKPKSETFQFSPDHKMVHTVISRYSGGLDGEGIEVTLKKFGNEWFVVDMKELYVS